MTPLAATATMPISTEISQGLEALRLSTPIEIFLLLSALSVLPILMIALTTFTRNIIVLSFLRQALGLQQTPPNIVLITFASFITLFSMSPVFDRSYSEGVKPYLDKQADFDESLSAAWKPLRSFMLQQTREEDIGLIYDLAKTAVPKTVEEVKPSYLVPAFLLSELRLAFQIGFIIFLPFLLIDLVVASVLMSLGMIMVPPITISLPLKIMLFVVVDGWTLIATTLVRSVST